MKIAVHSSTQTEEVMEEKKAIAEDLCHGMTLRRISSFHPLMPFLCIHACLLVIGCLFLHCNVWIPPIV